MLEKVQGNRFAGVTHRSDNGATVGRSDRWLARLGALLGIGALATATCCALPIVLATLGLGGAWLSLFDSLAAYRGYVLAAALAIVGAGWVAFLHRRRAVTRACIAEGCAPPPRRRATVVLLSTATGLIVAAWLAAEYQGPITQWLFALRETLRG
jgi:mercuric ion transport protein